MTFALENNPKYSQMVITNTNNKAAYTFSLHLLHNVTQYAQMFFHFLSMQSLVFTSFIAANVQQFVFSDFSV